MNLPDQPRAPRAGGPGPGPVVHTERGTGEEIAALYDASGRPVGRAPRSEVRAGNLHHAATAVIVFDRAGRVFVHQRTNTKDVYPGLFDFAAGGVLQDGEDPWEAARRELAEELGLSDPLNRIGEGEYTDAHTSYHAFLAWALTDDEPTLQPEEVRGGDWWALEDLLRAIEETPERFMPDTVALLGGWLAPRDGAASRGTSRRAETPRSDPRGDAREWKP